MPESFLLKVLTLDPRSIRTRLALYELLDECVPEALDGFGLPKEDWLVYRGPLGQQQLGSAFAVSGHLSLMPEGRSGPARLVWEAKCWTFEPHHTGWAVQQKALRLSPRLRAETYLGVCAQWALAHPRLAALGGVGARLPEQAQQTLKRLAVAGSRDTPDNERLLLGCGERLIELVDDETTDNEVTPMINVIRGDLAMIRFSDGLDDEAYRLVASIGRFMALATKTDAMSRTDRMVLVALEGAVATLNNLSHKGEETQ